MVIISNFTPGKTRKNVSRIRLYVEDILRLFISEQKQEQLGIPTDNIRSYDFSCEP